MLPAPPGAVKRRPGGPSGSSRRREATRPAAWPFPGALEPADGRLDGAQRARGPARAEVDREQRGGERELAEVDLGHGPIVRPRGPSRHGPRDRSPRRRSARVRRGGYPNGSATVNDAPAGPLGANWREPLKVALTRQRPSEGGVKAIAALPPLARRLKRV